VKRYLVLEQEDVVIEDLQVRASTPGERRECPAASTRGIGLKALVRSLKEDTEAKEIQRALDKTNWNRRAAAAELDISYKALLCKIKQHGLTPAAGRGGLYSQSP